MFSCLGNREHYFRENIYFEFVFSYKSPEEQIMIEGYINGRLMVFVLKNIERILTLFFLVCVCERFYLEHKRKKLLVNFQRPYSCPITIGLDQVTLE